MYEVIEILIYPIKSLGKVSLKESEAQIRGFQFDRRMMLTDENGNFLSQRKHPEMARFRVFMDKDAFRIQYAGDELLIPFQMKHHHTKMVTIWNDRLIAPETGGHYSKWFSDRLNILCHLIIMDDDTKRLVDPGYALQGETVSFSDGFPYLIIGNASLNDLNERLDKPVPMDRFRPNLVIDTREAFIEDSLDIFSIGNAVFKRVKPCARCIVTTTDQTTGIRTKEPLHTLSNYRKHNNKVLFGQNLICRKEGKVEIGDKLIPCS
jgi:uncharacterized protein YcbX